MSCDSDHRMVMAKLKLQKPTMKAKRPTKRFKLENLKNQECIEQLRNRLEEKMPTEEVCDIETEWKELHKNISTIAKEVVQVKISKHTKKKTTAWWTEEVKAAVKIKMKTFRRWMKTRNQLDRIEYEIARNEAERVKRRSKVEVWERIGRDLKQDATGTRKLIYSMAKNYRKGTNQTAHTIRDETGSSLLTEPDEIAERWKGYFEKLLNVETNIEQGEITEEHETPQWEYEDNEYEITQEEVKEAIERMKNGKAPGEDEIPVEIYKALGDMGIEWLTRVFNAAWNQGITPIDWGKAIVCPIHKKGEKCMCENYRGISLLSHASKIYERILEKRLRQTVETVLGEWHHGFRPGRGTTDLTFTLKMILEKSWEWNQKKCIAFIDLEKAFDRVPREKLWNALKHQEYNIGPKLYNAVKSVYNTCKSRVKCRDMDSDWFDVNSGVRQGGVLSPLLFIIFMDRCMKEICTNEEAETTLAYADDVAIITNNSPDLQDALNRWHEGLERHGMKLNKTKTEVMCVNRIKEECNIYIGGQKLKQVENFTYLGVNINEENLQQIEISNRITKYNNNLCLLYPLLKDNFVPIESKVLIYTTILRPILTYGSEAWSLTTKTKSMIQAAEMKVLRIIRRVTRLDKLRNTRIREELGVTSILDLIEKSKLRWYGHVQRMTDDRYPKKALNWTPEGRRPVGRPRMRWMKGVEEGLEKRGTTIEEVTEEELYQNRRSWRSLTEHSS